MAIIRQIKSKPAKKTKSSSKISINDISGIGTGILHPAFANRWRIWFNNREPNILTNQAISAKVDYSKRKVTVIIEQSLVGDEHEEVRKLAPGAYAPLNRFNFAIDTLDGGGGITCTTKFLDCILENHTLDYNYAINTMLQHVLEISFNRLEVTRPPVVSK